MGMILWLLLGFGICRASYATYRAEYDAHQRAERERPQRDCDAKLEHFLETYKVCATGETLVSLPDVDEALLRETVRRKQHLGWDVSLVRVNVSGRCDIATRSHKVHRTMAVLETVCHSHTVHNTTPLDPSCFLGTVSSGAWPRPGSFFGAIDRETVTISIPVIRFRLSEKVSCHEDAEPSLYQTRVRRMEQERSDWFLARFFDEKRIDPARDTYISLYKWPFAMPLIESSVDTMRADGWNMTLMCISIQGVVQGSGRPCTQCPHDPGLFLRDALKQNALLLSYDGNGFREQLLFDCDRESLNRDLDVIFVAKWVE